MVRWAPLGSVAVWLPVLLSCGEFDAYPEGDLCENAAVDDEGRPIHFPESRICRRKRPTTSDLDDLDGGTEVED